MKNIFLSCLLGFSVIFSTVGCVSNENKTKEQKIAEWALDVQDAVAVTTALVLKNNPDAKAKFEKAKLSLKALEKSVNPDVDMVVNVLKQLELEGVVKEDLDLGAVIAKIVLRRALGSTSLEFKSPEEVKVFAKAVREGITTVVPDEQ